MTAPNRTPVFSGDYRRREKSSDHQRSLLVIRDVRTTVEPHPPAPQRSGRTRRKRLVGLIAGWTAGIVGLLAIAGLLGWLLWAFLPR